MRTLLAPRWLLFHLLSLVAVVCCCLMSMWQWDRAHRTVAEALPAEEPVAIGSAGVHPGTIVEVSGTWDSSGMAAVPAVRDGASGFWLVGLVRPAAGDAVAVVAGWSATREVPWPSGGAVRVVGPFLPDERGLAVRQGDLMDKVDSAALGERAGTDVRAGWIALQSAAPALDAAIGPLRVDELPGASVGLSLRNAAYAVQWLAFAAFAVFFWFRFVKDEVHRNAPNTVNGGVL